MNNKLLIIFLICITAVAVVLSFKFKQKHVSEQDTQHVPDKFSSPLKTKPVIDYNNIEKNKELKALMQKRKAKYGIEKGVDLVTKADESFKIGDTTVSMQEILDKINLKRGNIIEKDLQTNDTNSYGKTELFGIYVVRQEDNIWNIHFKLLKDYFDHKGVALAPLADEPLDNGISSGIGKLLKFSENTVNIYNLKERKLDVDLSLILPLSKIVVYNMNQVFALLNLIDYKNVNSIHFDGETLWIPVN